MQTAASNLLTSYSQYLLFCVGKVWYSTFFPEFQVTLILCSCNPFSFCCPSQLYESYDHCHTVKPSAVCVHVCTYPGWGREFQKNSEQLTTDSYEYMLSFLLFQQYEVNHNLLIEFIRSCCQFHVGIPNTYSIIVMCAKLSEAQFNANDFL